MGEEEPLVKDSLLIVAGPAMPEFDGPAYVITEGVKVLWDLVIDSSDWASGFWTADDAAPVARLGKVCGFDRWEEIQAYVDAKHHAEEANAFINASVMPLPHRHLFEAPGRNFSQCQLPMCRVKKGSEQAVLDSYKRDLYDNLIEHEHVFSSVGRCMWPKCDVKEAKDGNDQGSESEAGEPAS